MTAEPYIEDTATAFRLAIVDDDPLFLERLVAMLSRDGGSRVFSATNGDDLLALLARDPVDCVVLDYDLGDETGLAVGERLKARFRDPPPVVMLTGGGSERTAVKAFRGGFSDYVSKRNLDINELLRAIRRAVARHVETHAASAEVEQLKRQLRVDPVTGLFTADHMHTLLTDAMRDPEHRSVLMVVALREMPQVRASLGHNVGDRVLRAFANRFRIAPGGVSLWGHSDGESFAYLLKPAPQPADLEAICQALVGALSFEVALDGMSVRLSPAVGAAGYPQNGTDPGAVGEAARRALGDAAAAGRAFGIAPAADAGLQEPAPSTTMPPDGAGADPDFIHRRVERRKERRQRVLKRGKIMVKGLQSVVDCTVRNLSPSGALLRVDSVFVAPSHFDLLIVGSGTTQAVALRWQKGNDIGVEFAEPSQ